MAQNPSQHHHRQLLALELDEENAPRLAARQRAKLVDGADLGRFLRLEP